MSVLAQRLFVVRFKDLDKWQVPRAGLIPPKLPKGWRVARVADFAQQITERVRVESGKQYKMLGVKWYGEGVFLRETVQGDAMSAAWVTPAKPGAFIYNRLFAWKESFAVVPPEFSACFVSGEFPQFIVDTARISAEYLDLLFRLRSVIRAVNAASAGSAAVSRNRFKEVEFLDMVLPVPPLETQRAILAEWRKAKAKIAAVVARADESETVIPGLIYAGLGTPAPEEGKTRERLMVLHWSEIDRWSFGFLTRKRAGLLGFSKSKYPIQRLRDHLLETANGYCIKPVGRQTAYHMLKLNALTPGGLDLSQTKFIDVPESVARRFCIKKGDLLICRSVGSFDLVAKCAVVPADAPNVLFPDIIIRARLKQSLLPDFVREVMQTPLGRSHFQSNARTAVGMWKIGADDIANFPLPVPPIDKQRQILEQVQKVRARIARERETARETARRIEADLESWLLGTKKIRGEEAEFL